MSVVPDERLARRVGAIAIAVMAAAIACFVFLPGRLGLTAPTRIRVVFRHVAGLREHAALVVAGQPVGRIEAIVPVTPASDDARGLLGGEVGVAVTVAIDGDSAWKVPASGEIFVASRGPLSDRYLEVAPPRGDPGLAVADGQVLRGVDPPSLDNVLQHTWTNMTTYQLFVATIRPELSALRAQLDVLFDQLDQLAGDPSSPLAARPAVLAREVRALVASARRTYDTALGGETGVAAARDTLGRSRAMIGELRAALDVLGPRATALAADLARVRGQLAASDPVARAEQVISKIRAALDQLEPLLAKIDELGDRIARGEGSLGRLMQDPEFPEDAKDLGKIMKRQPWKILARPPD
ncbi:MAG TPA: MlaD family protein [Kofleriaceae bacterium]|nr:MlaD family protein [Kofleriaceae bacterium]